MKDQAAGCPPSHQAEELHTGDGEVRNPQPLKPQLGTAMRKHTSAPAFTAPGGRAPQADERLKADQQLQDRTADNILKFPKTQACQDGRPNAVVEHQGQERAH